MSSPKLEYTALIKKQRMILLQLFEGNTGEEVQEQSSFTIEISDNWNYVLQPPTEEELQTLDALDPDGIVFLKEPKSC